ncbi:MAG: OsmC family protein [Bacteroidales bacterium]|nr:OsmC family protein [Bacteroidales bacterium]MCF8333220.1 OsmC family protein [Bacteroidales bacterium]
MGKTTTARVSLDKDMAFEAEVNGHTFMIDADEKVGGKDRGPRPKPLLLTSLAGCTAMDVISILRKMRVEPDEFYIEVGANNTEEHPKHYDSIKLIYHFRGKDLPREKLEKAVNLSQDRYCGVTHMLKDVANIHHEIKIDE